MIQIKTVQTSKDGTKKFLLELEDGNLIETVLMKHPYGNSVCVTSQAGCNMGCAFCASGLTKKVRNLTAEEMLGQVLIANDSLPDTCEQVTHIVVMGTGEPFDNYDEVLHFCDLVSDERKLSAVFHEADTLKNVPNKANITSFKAIAPRHITVSTCGLVPKIYEFAQTEKRYNLAISLHAPNNELRDRLMPVNKKYPLEELLPAAAEYCKKTKRRITFEYLLLDGVNDNLEHANELAELLRILPDSTSSDILCPKQDQTSWDSSDYFYVNLIPYNNVSEFGFQGSSKETALQFYDVLMKNGIKATLRKERGADITAACGQLRLKMPPAQTQSPRS